MATEEWLAWQREFFSLAGTWLLTRWVAVDPVNRMPKGFDPIGTQIGELDQMVEMQYMIEERKHAQTNQSRPAIAAGHRSR